MYKNYQNINDNLDKLGAVPASSQLKPSPLALVMAACITMYNHLHCHFVNGILFTT